MAEGTGFTAEPSSGADVESVSGPTTEYVSGTPAESAEAGEAARRIAPVQLLPRLPLYFLIDCSRAMDGEYNVALYDDVQIARSRLAGTVQTAPRVYVSTMALRAAAMPPLRPVWSRESSDVPDADAEGALLAPALYALDHQLTYDAIDPTRDHPGDLTPLVFLVLGAPPRDDPREIEAALATLFRADQRHRPFIVALERRPLFTATLRRFCAMVFHLHPERAEALQVYFEWAAQLAFNVAAASADPARPEPELPPISRYGFIQTA